MDETLQFLNLIEDILTEEIEKEEKEKIEPEKTEEEKRKELILNGYKYGFGFR
jgi:hypothetical protein